MVFDELETLNARSRTLRHRLSQLKEDIQSFMRNRNLERLGTRDGRLAVRVMSRNVAARPGKKETVKCIDELVGEENPELAQRLLNRLYEDNKVVRTYTRFDKRDVDETA